MKRIISLFMAVLFAFGVCITAQAKTQGDVNGDGKVNSTDALKVLQYSVNIIKSIDKTAADVNGDGKINSTDALIILQISVGLHDNSKYKVIVTLTAKVGNKYYDSGDVIPVKSGDTVYVTLALSNNFYTGPTSAQLYYNNSIFASAPNAQFNTNGRFYEACGRQMCGFTDWNKIATENKEKCWPDYSASKLAEFKKNHKFLRVTMTPNSNLTSEVPKSINEDLVTIEFKVSSSVKKGTTGQIVIPVESRRRKDYQNGHLMCSVYESADITSKSSPYVDGLSYNCTNAVLNFKVS
ncbi:MAG: dockerin type I repeat-containing protein [Clostridia bacterium]|nr:dockerin type I repeat-containing protein [Clostridia bacterium]